MPLPSNEPLVPWTRDECRAVLKEWAAQATRHQARRKSERMSHRTPRLRTEQIYDIRARYDAAAETLRVIGVAHGCTVSNVWEIGQRRTWRWLPERAAA